jgi:DNA-binding CsgD family transcriptional regulator
VGIALIRLAARSIHRGGSRTSPTHDLSRTERDISRLTAADRRSDGPGRLGSP